MSSPELKRPAEEDIHERAEKRSKTQRPDANEDGQVPENPSEESFESCRFEKCEACFGVVMSFHFWVVMQQLF